MKTYPFVEDYIQIIAGTLCHNTGKRSPSFLSSTPLSLARYDVSVIDSFAQQIENGTGFTDRQAELAVKIILKYEKQLGKLGIDIVTLENPKFQFPIRSIDRSLKLYVENNSLICRFPYNETLVSSFKKLTKDSQGSTRFDKDKKAWVLATTEYNVNLAYNFAQANNFEIDTVCNNLMNEILETEQFPYEIKLVLDNDRLVITNAEQSLLDYLKKKIGELTLEKLHLLIDHAPILGYTVDKELEELAVSIHGARIYNLLNSRHSNLGSSSIEKNMNDVVTLAKLTGRWPIHLFEPDLSGNLLAIGEGILGEDKVHKVTKFNSIPDDCLAIYYNKFDSSSDISVPLLVSTHGMMFGGDKQVLVDRAEKIVYFAADVYNAGKVKIIGS